MIHSMMQRGNDGPNSSGMPENPYRPTSIDPDVNLLAIFASFSQGGTYWLVKRQNASDYSTMAPTTASGGIALDLATSPTPNLVELNIDIFEGDSPGAFWYQKNNGTPVQYSSGISIVSGDVLKFGVTIPIGTTGDGRVGITVTTSGSAGTQTTYYFYLSYSG
jgi:hypothetical protein